MMADLADAVTHGDDGLQVEEWVDVGSALPLRTHAVDLRVTETPDGGFVFEITARNGHVLDEPVSVVGDGGLSVRVAVR
jgi:hypothetical protein